MHRAVLMLGRSRVRETSPAQTLSITRVGIRIGGVGAPPELDEVPMPILGGLEIHRKADHLRLPHTVTRAGVPLARSRRADRVTLRAWLAVFARPAGFGALLRGSRVCPVWRYFMRNWPHAGITAHLFRSLSFTLLLPLVPQSCTPNTIYPDCPSPVLLLS